MNAASIIVLAALSAAPALKLGDVQALEIVQLLWLIAASAVFLYRGLRVPCSGLWRRYGPGYLAFIFLCLIISALAFRLRFYPLPETSLFKSPGWLSMARILEFGLDILLMLTVARAMATRRKLLHLGLSAYVWVGTLSAVASLAGWVLMKLAAIPTFLLYGPEDRVRGFFNEGGPYGIYLVSVAIVVLFRGRVAQRSQVHLVPLAGALLLSGSKAALLAIVCLGLIAVTLVGNVQRRAAILGATVAVLVTSTLLYQGKLYGYMWSYMNFDEALEYRPGDPSLIMGRIAAAIVVPRMIANHPLLGIGAGNYSLMRNDPQYLEGLPPVDDWDLPGVGLLGTAAELGIPLTLFLVWLLLRPFSAARHSGAPAIVAVAAAFPALAFLFGANLNFFYPWLVGAFAISTESSQC